MSSSESRTYSSYPVSKHGTHVAPGMAVLADLEPNNVNDETLDGVLRRFSSREYASDNPSALGNISCVYKNAIQLTEASTSAQMRGIGLLAVVMIVTPIAYLASDYAHAFKSEFYLNNISYFRICMYFFMTWFVLFPIRHCLIGLWHRDMFAAEDEPTIFDRKHRKVYCLFAPHEERSGSWYKFFRPMQLQAVEYDWGCITAEHRVEVVYSGQTVSRRHRLVLVVRDYPAEGASEGRLLDEIIVGNSMALGEQSVPMLWEHIRRYMENKGPPLQKDEPMQVFERPTNLWQSMGIVSPYGPRFFWWWRTNRFPVIVILMMFPVTLPFSLLWSVCNWISHMTMRKTVWPEEIHQRLGEPVLPRNPDE